MARDAYKGPRILPFLRHEEISRCESCGRRRRDIDLTRGVCRCCLAQADADHADEFGRDEWGMA